MLYEVITLLHVHLAAHEVRQPLEAPRALARERDARERQPRAQAVLLAQGQGHGTGVAHGSEPRPPASLTAAAIADPLASVIGA